VATTDRETGTVASSHYARLKAGVSPFYRRGWTSPQLDPLLVEQGAAQALSPKHQNP
jgi:hypothetical protein